MLKCIGFFFKTTRSKTKSAFKLTTIIEIMLTQLYIFHKQTFSKNYTFQTIHVNFLKFKNKAVLCLEIVVIVIIVTLDLSEEFTIN